MSIGDVAWEQDDGIDHGGVENARKRVEGSGNGNAIEGLGMGWGQEADDVEERVAGGVAEPIAEGGRLTKIAGEEEAAAGF